MLRDSCPDVKFTKLPSVKVLTHDDHKIKRGDRIYFRFAPGPKPSEYVVISDHAHTVEKDTKILVIGKGRVAAGMNPLDFVKDVALWEEFHRKRYK